HLSSKYCCLLRKAKLPKIRKENSVLLLKKSNFDRALKETKYLLVEFYAPWSYECRKLLPIWDELGEKYQSHEDVIIAKIDVTANDVLSVVMDRYPFFRLFPAGPDIQVRNLGGCHSCMLMGVFRIEAHPLSKTNDLQNMLPNAMLQNNQKMLQLKERKILDK
uniref:Thioredoxin domain-containing protein n=1 Tax=Meleagris gallopavo TaxID=9103 RepID=A0A803YK45_MELGA